jgi:hypothetical protein
MPDNILYPKLCLLFRNSTDAAAFEMMTIKHLGEWLEIERQVTVIKIIGADHPELRADLLRIAKGMGADQIPESFND